MSVKRLVLLQLCATVFFVTDVIVFPRFLYTWLTFLCFTQAIFGALIFRSHTRQDQQFRQKTRALVGNLTRNIIHDFSNPLSVISMVLMLFQDLAQTEDLKEVYTRIKSSYDRLNRTLRNYRIYSENAAFETPQYASVSDVLKAALEHCEKRMTRNQMKIENLYQGSSEIYCYSTSLAAAISQLVFNSIDASLKKPDSWIKVQVQESSDTLSISVSDNGKGFTAEERQNLFNPFFSSLNYKFSTGLGLTIVQEIAQKHEGKVALTKTEPYTEFVLTLPKKQANENQSDGTLPGQQAQAA